MVSNAHETFRCIRSVDEDGGGLAIGLVGGVIDAPGPRGGGGGVGDLVVCVDVRLEGL